MDKAADAFDSMVECLMTLGDFGWRLTKDVTTNTWKISEPVIKPTAAMVKKKLKESGLAGW